jgi:hypothetical protein
LNMYISKIVHYFAVNKCNCICLYQLIIRQKSLQANITSITVGETETRWEHVELVLIPKQNIWGKIWGCANVFRWDVIFPPTIATQYMLLSNCSLRNFDLVQYLKQATKCAMLLKWLAFNKLNIISQIFIIGDEETKLVIGFILISMSNCQG